MKQNMSFISFVLMFFVLQQPLAANPVPSATTISILGPTTITQPGSYTLAQDIKGTLYYCC